MYRAHITKTDSWSRTTDELETIREAGQIIAWALTDNGCADRKTATKMAMQAERNRELTHGPYTFTIEQYRKGA